MRIESPDPKPRDNGDYDIYFTIGYGDPRGDIVLDEAGMLRLDDVRPEDCDRLIKAATEIKSRVLASRARMTAPHGRGNIHKGTCQLCGKAEDDQLHADPKPLVISDSTIEQARYLAEHPTDAEGVAAAIGGLTEAVAEAVNAPETEAGDDDVICATPGCGHRDRHHFGNPNSVGRRGCTGDFVDHGCKCGDFTYPAPETADPAYPDVSGGGVPYPSEAVESVRRSREATSW